MLATVIFDVLQEFLLQIKISRLIPDMAEISTSIQEQLEHSVRAFVRSETHQQCPFRAY
jgi:hypothetical protein